jgi:nucleoside-diphosphate kinase
MERTCVIVKPDGVGKRVIGEVIGRLEKEGLKLIGLKMVRPSSEQIEGFYSVHKGKPFYGPLVAFMLSGPIVVSVWEANGAIKKVRAIIGATNSKEAAPGTLRNLYGTDNRRNLVHASDAPENAIKEIDYFFNSNELVAYDWNDWTNS